MAVAGGWLAFGEKGLAILGCPLPPALPSPPELSADLVDRGMILAGGGALIRGLDKFISEQTGLPVLVADDPLTAVARGTGKVLQDLQWLIKDISA